MIYIVEDDDAIRELEQYALQSNGYEVASFASSEPFWQAMRTEAPELVILDVMLPGEDGFSILKKLRNTPSLHRLPIIMVTAKSSELDTVRGLDCGADDYISKPFGIMEFLSRVRAALRRSAPEARPNVLSFHEILLDNAREARDFFSSFEGNTGPYILYTIVRIKSILAKYGKPVSGAQLLPPESAEQKQLMLVLSRMADALWTAYRDSAPNAVCAYIYELATAANKFYHDVKILTEPDERRQASYAALIDLTRGVLETCIDLLGFSAPERM